MRLALWRALVLAIMLGPLMPLHVQASELASMSPAQILGAEQWDMKARDGRMFRIFVMPPPRGVEAGEFPVLFVLDGNVQFAIAASQALARNLYGETRPAMIVGIGYPFGSVEDYLRSPRPRNRDLTPGQPAIATKDGNFYGGADDFFRFIDQELRPELKRRYPSASSDDQWLFGHSLAGLFTLHTMMSHPAAFRGYIAASPSLWFNAATLESDKTAFAMALADGATFPPLLVTVGGRETLDPEVSSMAARLGSLPGAAGQFAFRRFPDETHMSTIPAAISRAIGFALAIPKPEAVLPVPARR